MKTLMLFLLVVSGHSAAAVIHILKILDTASSGVPNFPEYVVVGLVNEVQIGYYDSNTERIEPKQEWMNRIKEDDPEFWKSQTEIFLRIQHFAKANFDILKQRFNQTGGAHTYQKIYGCEWDDETNEINGFYQIGYDGEDFIVFDLKTETWIAPRHQALITKQQWDADKARIERIKYDLTQYCPEQLKKLVNYGRNSLLRTERPSVSVLQKTSSSPISCHATGFYPDKASLFWRKDGEELHEDVDLGEILPNHDGTFQMSVDLKLSVPPEDHERYECVFQLSGVKENIVTKMDNIRTNRENPAEKPAEKPTHIVTIIIIIVAVVVLAAVIGVIVCRKKKSANCRDCHDDAGETSELSTRLNENPES